MFKALKEWIFDPRVIRLEKDLQIQGVDLHTLRHHAQGQAEELKAMGMTNVDLHNQLDELETLNKRQFKTMGELRQGLDAAKKRNLDYMEENEHLLKNLEKAENLVIKVKGELEVTKSNNGVIVDDLQNYIAQQAKENNKLREDLAKKGKPELTKLKNSLKGLKIDCMKWKAGQRAWLKHENRMGVQDSPLATRIF
jgi:regulator of replication initiation timing